LEAGLKWSITRVGLGTITVFDLFINDLDLNVHNVLLKFADDTKICSRICNIDDVQKLQEGLNILQEWAHTRQMQFNIHKCKVMHVGVSHSGLKRVYEYSMGNQKLKYCDTERDLKVVVSRDLKVESQFNHA